MHTISPISDGRPTVARDDRILARAFVGPVLRATYPPRPPSMVKFGERLHTLMTAGWESHYIDYNALKQMIEAGNLGDAFGRRLETV